MKIDLTPSTTHGLYVKDIRDSVTKSNSSSYIFSRLRAPYASLIFIASSLTTYYSPANSKTLAYMSNGYYRILLMISNETSYNSLFVPILDGFDSSNSSP